jgi:L-ascorbate metabolism protein UlaG (beta-lactamase superfamily)
MMNDRLVTRPITSSFFAQRHDTRFAWLGMAGVILNVRGTLLLIDPLITLEASGGRELCEGDYPLKVPLPIEAKDIPRVDYVLYTHADNDHFGRLTAALLAGQPQCRFIAPPPVERALLELGVPPGRLITARDFVTIQAGDAEVYITPALHNWQEKDGWQRGDCCGYLIKTPDGTIWHPGDTRLIPELLQVRDVDVIFFDVAAVEAHLGPQGSARLAASSGARLMIAYHYGTFDLPPGSFATFDPDDSLPYLAGLSAEFSRPSPGELVRLPLP